MISGLAHTALHVTDAPLPPAVTRLGCSHVALLCDDVAATRADLEAEGVTFLVEKVRYPDRPYYRQY